MQRLAKATTVAGPSLAPKAPDAAESGHRRAGVLAAVAAIAALCMTLSASRAQAATPECEGNEDRRVEQAATFLPNCRAYELVSEPTSSPRFTPIVGGGTKLELVRVAAGGDAVSYFSWYPWEAAEGGKSVYLATRNASAGWSSGNVIPPQSPSARTGCEPSMYFSPQLTAGVLVDGHLQQEQPYCGSDDPSLVPSEEAGFLAEPALKFQNLFLREDLRATPTAFRLVNRTPVTATPTDAWLQDATSQPGAELSHIAFSEAAQLTPEALGAPAGELLYEWAAGDVHLISVLPDGSPVVGSLVDFGGENYREESSYIGAAPYMHAMSANGATVFFDAGEDLFARINATGEPSTLEGEACLSQTVKACTVQLDVSQAGGPGGGGRFLAATEDGSLVFFADNAEAKLTSDTKAESGENLYAYDVANGELRDLTPESSQAGVLGLSGIAGGTAAEFRLYFVADGVLSGADREGREPQKGQPNLYALSAGATTPTFIATLDAASDASDWNAGNLTARLSPNGRYLAFDSRDRLTKYDNTDPISHESQPEIYRYDAGTQALTCVSCVPDESPPTSGGARLFGPTEGMSFNAGPGYLSRNVLNDGEVIFQTDEALVSRDSNGVTDVYDYTEGQPQLISTGDSPDPSLFGDTDEQGSNVFFATTQALVGRDTDSALSLYDARVGGGFAEPAAAAPCSAEGCRGSGPEALSPLTAPPSVSFEGPGNLRVAPTPARPTPQTRKARLLRGALKACALAHRHSRRKRRECKRRARTRAGAKASRTRKGRHAHHRNRRGGGK